MAKKNTQASVNYAAPGSQVGLQAENVVLTGGIRLGTGNDGGIQIGHAAATDDDDDPARPWVTP